MSHVEDGCYLAGKVVFQQEKESKTGKRFNQIQLMQNGGKQRTVLYEIQCWGVSFTQGQQVDLKVVPKADHKFPGRIFWTHYGDRQGEQGGGNRELKV